MAKVVQLQQQNHPLHEITAASREALMAAADATSGPRSTAVSLFHAAAVALVAERVDRQHAKDFGQQQFAQMVDLVYNDRGIR